jgi:peptidyl-tRNA hydrolase, PTH1 family
MAKTIELKTVLILGLGNPGQDYYYTRHSLGFMVVDAFAKKHNFGDFVMVEDNTLACEGEFNGTRVILAKPQTFMNKSGIAAKRLAKHYSLFKNKKFDNLWIINDDLDIPQGKIKISQNRNAAGHKGVQSIIDQLKTKNFTRFRLGIAPLDTALKKIPGDKLVLKKLSEAEQIEFDKIIASTIAALDLALSEGPEKSMTEFNQ